MSYTYWLPDATGAKKDYTTESNAVVIIGANGAGKSKLGAWIEQKSMISVHRIAAQRSLNFQENIPLKSYSQAEAGFFYGGDTRNSNKGARWNYGNSYTTQLINDFDDVLSAMIALRNKANDKFVAECKVAEAGNKTKPNTPNTVIDKLQEIWKCVFPHRELIYDDAKFYASFVKNGAEVKYSANQMSDGERAVLYLTSQVLCVPQNKILIMDEPEIHLHRSLINRLWVALENARKDCLFILRMIHNSLHSIVMPIKYGCKVLMERIGTFKNSRRATFQKNCYSIYWVTGRMSFSWKEQLIAMM